MKLRGRAHKRLRSLLGQDLILGGLALGVAALVLVTLGYFYLRPPGKQTITFQTTDASAIATGQDVRVAGISIGKVSDISIGQDHVTVHARVTDSTFIGDQSRIEVRMLTPVGGYAVTLIPMGSNPAPGGEIPVERVQVPYSIGDVLQSAPKVTDEVDGTSLEANMAQVADALTEFPSALGSVVDGMGAVTEVLDHQRAQVHEIAALAAEYLQSFNANRQFVFELIQKIDSVITTYNNNKVGFNRTYELLSNSLWMAQPLEEYHLSGAGTLGAQVQGLEASLSEILSTLNPAIDNLVGLRGQLVDWVTPEGMRELGGGTMWLSAVCVPLAGRDC